MNHLPLPDNAARQAIDSEAIFLEWLRVAHEAKKFTGGMYFKREGQYAYLVKTSPDNRQTRLGVRDEKTEETLKAFTEGKKRTEDRLKSLRESLREAERLNKALRVGRVPNLVVDVLNELELAGLGAYFTVVGTHALYAYEAAASVRFEAGALATQDVDLLWDARKRVQFASTMSSSTPRCSTCSSEPTRLSSAWRGRLSRPSTTRGSWSISCAAWPPRVTHTPFASRTMKATCGRFRPNAPRPS